MPLRKQPLRKQPLRKQPLRKQPLRRPLPVVLALSALSALACGGSDVPTPWSETEGREEVVAGQPTDGPTPGGAASGSATRPADGDRPRQSTPAGDGDLACDPAVATPSPAGGIVGRLSCGSTIEGWSGAGTMVWGDDFYQQAFCTPRRSGYGDAPEVLYELELDADVQADIVLESPCADLDLVAVAWRADGVPDLAHTGRIAECEMATGRDGGKVRLTTVGKAQRYLIGVDGKDGDEGNFRLRVECSTYR